MYTSWDQIPANLCTITALKKRGVKVDDHVLPVAFKVGGQGPFGLYDVEMLSPDRFAFNNATNFRMAVLSSRLRRQQAAQIASSST